MKQKQERAKASRLDRLETEIKKTDIPMELGWF